MKNQTSEIKEIHELIGKSFISKLTDREQQLLLEWLDKDPKHQELFEELKQKSNWDKRQQIADNIDLNYEWNRFKLRTTNTKKHLSKTILRIVKYAAAILLPILVTLILLQKNHNHDFVVTNKPILTPGHSQAQLVLSDGRTIDLKGENQTLRDSVSGIEIENKDYTLNYVSDETDSISQPKVFHEIIVGKGEEYQLVLADSSRVYLNSDTHIKFPVQFSANQREIFLLAGEAFFEVKKDIHAPFKVKTEYVTVEVLGTSFNLSSYKNESTIHTTLVNGSVKVTPQFGHAPAQILAPNEQALLDKNSNKIVTRKVDVSLFCDWRNGYFTFDNEKLEDVFKKLSRWYNIQAFFVSESAKHERFTGKIPRLKNCNELLEMIDKTTDVKFQIDQDKNVIIKR